MLVFHLNKSFWVDPCSDWALNRTWALIKKNKKSNTAKSVTQVSFHKNHKISSKSDKNILVFL